MARIEPTRGRPEFPQRGQGGKISDGLKRNRDLTMEVAGNAHLHQFEPTASSFSADPAGNFQKTNSVAGRYF